MAKRRRLSPALLNGTDERLGSSGPSGTETGSPPIARIAADTSSQAAFEDVARALSEAREEGRLAQVIPLDAVETEHLSRDRIAFDAEDMQALKDSLQARGQQVPIEVVDRGEGRFGLISGLRRVMALKSLGATQVLAVLRRPETAAEAYLSMVEENELRSGISFYERARIACEAVRLGIHPDLPAAIQSLFPSASPAKRSKIGTFATVHNAVGDKLRFPAAIPERLGLALGAALAQGGDVAVEFATRLVEADPQDAETERTVIETIISETRSEKTLAKAGRGRPATKPQLLRPGLVMERRAGKVVLSGEELTDDLLARLEHWLKSG
ncbi:plasmid partitioning protein RepB [Jannaschia seosinensis]|uniref:Plasmid partitioning protein RepB n=1 Tax=Jannaschia seosinensis TaxID=313367 RepID=A0A0M7B4R1_9RHOB|nr:ParB N-terminal domain-containing protein [Jannaschia seosinensis]CUH20190.1 plasmid partitioning protein RepB [Jannaschia seosinensis]